MKHYLKTFLNFENSLRFENLFKTNAQNSPATGLILLQAIIPKKFHSF